MSGWPNIELFALLLSVPSEYYVRISMNVQDEFECSPVFTVPTLPVFVYYPDVFLRDGGSTAANWHVVINDYVFIVLFCLLPSARNGAAGVIYIGSRMGGNSQVRLSPAIWCSTRSKCYWPSPGICGRGFVLVASMIAYNRSSKGIGPVSNKPNGGIPTSFLWGEFARFSSGD